MTLQALYNYFGRHFESGWIIKPSNAQVLYDFIQEHPIKRVLDLGTGIGCSSAIAALALKDKGEKDYHIDSVEQFDKCVKLAKELIPQELQTNMVIHKANVVTWQTEGIPYQYFSVYDTLPEGDYDLIINDGPGPFMENGKYIDLPNGTVQKLLLENKLKPGTFVAFDGRILFLKLLERHFSRNFYLYLPNKQGSDLNIIQKKDSPLEFADDTLEMMQRLRYFDEPTEVMNAKQEEIKDKGKKDEQK